MTAPPRLTDDERKRFCRALEASSSPVTLSPSPNPELLTLIPGRSPETPLRRFNGAAIWSQLSPEQQAAFGAAALELAIARYGVEVARGQREERLFLAAEEGVQVALDQRAEQHVFIDGVVSPRKVPGIPSLLGPICRQCGCTNHDAPGQDRGDSDSWAEPDLCRPCAADTQIRPRTAPAPEGSS